MIGDISKAEHIYIAVGYTDMRKQIDGLATIVQKNFRLDPFSNSLFLFCGRNTSIMKALYWEGAVAQIMKEKFVNHVPLYRNKTAQLVFSSHDIGLMDCAKLFRKEQIWFIHKDEQGVYLYSLAAFTAKDGVRETTDIIEKYKKGLHGSIPDPKLIDTLISVQKGKDESI